MAVQSYCGAAEVIARPHYATGTLYYHFLLYCSTTTPVPVHLPPSSSLAMDPAYLLVDGSINYPAMAFGPHFLHKNFSISISGVNGSRLMAYATNAGIQAMSIGHIWGLDAQIRLVGMVVSSLFQGA